MGITLQSEGRRAERPWRRRPPEELGVLPELEGQVVRGHCGAREALVRGGTPERKGGDLDAAEFEQHWREMTEDFKKMVMLGGEVSADLLAGIVEGKGDRHDLLMKCGYEEAEATCGEIFLKELQRDAESKVKRLTGLRVAQRKQGASLEMAVAARVANNEVPKGMLDGRSQTWHGCA